MSGVLIAILLWFLKDKMWKKILSLENPSNVRTETFMERYKPQIDGDKVSCAKKLDGSIMLSCEHVFQNKQSLLQKFVCHWSFTSWQFVWFWVENLSTKTISYFGLKVIYNQAHLTLHTNMKNMIVSTVCYCCCFLTASFCCINDLCINSCLDDHRNQYVFSFNWSFILFRNHWGHWKKWKIFQWDRWWQKGDKW